MAIQNINTIQNPSQLKELINYDILESLQNLGQRQSLKGDGITSANFTINDIVSIENPDKDSFIGKLFCENDGFFLSILERDNLNGEPIAKEEFKYTINNYVIVESNVTLNTKINGIDYYDKNMLIYRKDDYLYICYLGASVDPDTIVELNVEKYDIVKNTLVESLKLIDLNDKNNNVFLYYLKTVKNNNNTTSTEIIELPISLESIAASYENDFSQFVSDFYSNTVINYYKTYKQLEVSDIFEELKEYSSVSNNGLEAFTYSVNVSNNTSNDNITTGFSLNENAGNSLQINTILYYMFNQEIELYPFVFELYNNYMYKLDNKQLNKMLLFNIFNTAFNQAKNNFVANKDISEFELFIPLNYIFDYYVNNNDKFFIYSNETPINVFYTVNNITTSELKTIFAQESNVNNLLICNADNYTNVVLYKFIVNYNQKIEKLINNISIVKMYSTPYIYENLWYINDIKTNYTAIGKDAGNPNIVMIYESSNGNNTIQKNILTTDLYNKFTDIDWTRKTTKVQLFNKNIITKDSTNYKREYELDVEVPLINKNQLDLFKDCIICCFSHINLCLKDETTDIAKETFGSDSIITTFWKIDTNPTFDEKYSFETIVDPLSDSDSNESYSLTLFNLANINNIVDYIAKFYVENYKIEASNNFNSISLNTQQNFKNTLNSENIKLKIYNDEVNNLTELSTSSNKTKLVVKYIDANNKDADIFNYNTIIESEALASGPQTGEFTKNIPTVDVASVFLKDINAFNNVTITSPIPNQNSTGHVIYQSYFGTVNKDTANVIHFGYNTTVNSKNGETTTFKHQDTVSFDYSNFIQNASSLISYTETVTNYNLNETVTYIINTPNIKQYFIEKRKFFDNAFYMSNSSAETGEKTNGHIICCYNSIPISSHETPPHPNVDTAFVSTSLTSGVDELLPYANYKPIIIEYINDNTSEPDYYKYNNINSITFAINGKYFENVNGEFGGAYNGNTNTYHYTSFENAIKLTDSKVNNVTYCPYIIKPTIYLDKITNVYTIKGENAIDEPNKVTYYTYYTYNYYILKGYVDYIDMYTEISLSYFDSTGKSTAITLDEILKSNYTDNAPKAIYRKIIFKNQN